MSVNRAVKKLTPAEAKQKMYRFCAYQERCHQEVKSKLYEFGLNRGDVDTVITELITEGFLNEERFSKAFAGGKFRMKQWGRVKIEHELQSKGLTGNCIKAGLKEIDEEIYQNVLVGLVEKKSAQYKDLNLFVKRDKVASYLIGRGYEPELVWKVVKEYLKP
jgi:regulatory protein